LTGLAITFEDLVFDGFWAVFFETFVLDVLVSSFLDFVEAGLTGGFVFLVVTEFPDLVGFFTSVFFVSTFLVLTFSAGLLAFGNEALAAGFFSATFFIGLTTWVIWPGFIFALPAAGLVLVTAMMSSSGQDINPCQVRENGPERV
jgi:hypothetical protein